MSKNQRDVWDELPFVCCSGWNILIIDTYYWWRIRPVESVPSPSPEHIDSVLHSCTFLRVQLRFEPEVSIVRCALLLPPTLPLMAGIFCGKEEGRIERSRMFYIQGRIDGNGIKHKRWWDSEITPLVQLPIQWRSGLWKINLLAVHEPIMTKALQIRWH